MWREAFLVLRANQSKAMSHCPTLHSKSVGGGLSRKTYSQKIFQKNITLKN